LTRRWHRELVKTGVDRTWNGPDINPADTDAGEEHPRGCASPPPFRSAIPSSSST